MGRYRSCLPGRGLLLFIGFLLLFSSQAFAAGPCFFGAGQFCNGCILKRKMIVPRDGWCKVDLNANDASSVSVSEQPLFGKITSAKSFYRYQANKGFRGKDYFEILYQANGGKSITTLKVDVEIQ